MKAAISYFFSPKPVSFVLYNLEADVKKATSLSMPLCCMPHADGLPNTADMSPEALEQQAHNLQERELACLVAPAFNLCLEA